MPVSELEARQRRGLSLARIYIKPPEFGGHYRSEPVAEFANFIQQNQAFTKGHAGIALQLSPFCFLVSEFPSFRRFDGHHLVSKLYLNAFSRNRKANRPPLAYPGKL